MEVSAGAIIFIRNNEIRYLLLYKKASPPYKESWGFPRGNVDDGENEMQAAVREVKEETGITYLKFVKNFREQVEFFYMKERRLTKKRIVYFLAETNNEDVKISHEHTSYSWLEIDDALARLKHKGAKEILEKAHKLLTV